MVKTPSNNFLQGQSSPKLTRSHIIPIYSLTVIKIISSTCFVLFIMLKKHNKFSLYKPKNPTTVFIIKKALDIDYP